MVNPLLLVGALIGTISGIFIIAFFSIKNRKEAIGFDRNMKDTELIRRLILNAAKTAFSEEIRESFEI